MIHAHQYLDQILSVTIQYEARDRTKENRGIVMRESNIIPIKRDSSHGASNDMMKKSDTGISFNRCGKKRKVILRVNGHRSVVSSPTDIYSEDMLI